MQIPKNVFPKSGILNLILGKQVGNSIGPFVFLPKKVYEDLLLNNPKIHSLALLQHEQVHSLRQQKIGFLKFGIKYLFNNQFRFEEELLAVTTALRYLKQQNFKFNYNPKKNMELEQIYLWPVSKYYSSEQLQKLWEQL